MNTHHEGRASCSSRVLMTSFSSNDTLTPISCLLESPDRRKLCSTKFSMISGRSSIESVKEHVFPLETPREIVGLELNDESFITIRCLKHQHSFGRASYQEHLEDVDSENELVVIALNSFRSPIAKSCNYISVLYHCNKCNNDTYILLGEYFGSYKNFLLKLQDLITMPNVCSCCRQRTLLKKYKEVDLCPRCYRHIPHEYVRHIKDREFHEEVRNAFLKSLEEHGRFKVRKREYVYDTF